MYAATLPAVSRIDDWFAEEPRRGPAEIACALANDRFWLNDRLRLIGTHPDWPEAAHLLHLNEELAHALVLVLSRLPTARRRAFADAFYTEQFEWGSWLPSDARARSALGAALVLKTFERVDSADISDERTLDLLRGAAQGDDLTRTPSPAVGELWKAIARIRFDVANDDPADPRGALALALVEVLDPSSELVDVKEVLARCAWAVVDTQGPSSALGFLLDAERLLADA